MRDPQAVAAHAWGKQMENQAGPCAWAVRVKDFDAEVKRLREAGVTVGAPVRGGRARPDGARLEWETAQVGEEPSGTFFPFLIRDLAIRWFQRYAAQRCIADRSRSPTAGRKRHRATEGY